MTRLSLRGLTAVAAVGFITTMFLCYVALQGVSDPRPHVAQQRLASLDEPHTSLLPLAAWSSPSLAQLTWDDVVGGDGGRVLFVTSELAGVSLLITFKKSLVVIDTTCTLVLC